MSLAETSTEDWRLRSSRAVLLALRGQLHDAVRMHEALLEEIGELPVPHAVEQRLHLAMLHLEWNDLERASRYVPDAFDNVARCHAEVLTAPLNLGRAWRTTTLTPPRARSITPPRRHNVSAVWSRRGGHKHCVHDWRCCRATWHARSDGRSRFEVMRRCWNRSVS